MNAPPTLGVVRLCQGTGPWYDLGRPAPARRGSVPQASIVESVGRGSYLVNGVGGCFGCHSSQAGYLAGGREFALPFIPPDAEGRRPSLHTISRPMKMLRDSLHSIGFEGLDTWFMLAPQATENLSIGRYRANAVLIGGNSEIYDDGIGLSAGQLLNPRGRCGNGGWTDSDVHSLRRVRTQNISGCPCR